MPVWILLQPRGYLGGFILYSAIACGACSGFHRLVCSGTTAKQIDKESHMKMVGYGAMLCEALVAVIALATIMIWSADDIVGLKPGTIYGKGIGEFLSLIIGKEHLLYCHHLWRHGFFHLCV